MSKRALVAARALSGPLRYTPGVPMRSSALCRAIGVLGCFVLMPVAGMAQTPHAAPKAAQRTATAPPLPANVRSALNSITASDLKGDLSFLASDALEGRFTPSPGLETAAEFIASRFRAAGLEPGGDHEYFQT